MKRSALAQDSNTFVGCVEEVRNNKAGDRQMQRRLECARRRLKREAKGWRAREPRLGRGGRAQ